MAKERRFRETGKKSDTPATADLKRRRGGTTNDEVETEPETGIPSTQPGVSRIKGNPDASRTGLPAQGDAEPAPKEHKKEVVDSSNIDIQVALGGPHHEEATPEEAQEAPETPAADVERGPTEEETSEEALPPVEGPSAQDMEGDTASRRRGGRRGSLEVEGVGAPIEDWQGLPDDYADEEEPQEDEDISARGDAALPAEATADSASAEERGATAGKR